MYYALIVTHKMTDKARSLIREEPEFFDYWYREPRLTGLDAV